MFVRMVQQATGEPTLTPADEINKSTPATATGNSGTVQPVDSSIITSTSKEASHFKLQVLEVYTNIVCSMSAVNATLEMFMRCGLCALLVSLATQL
jgi:hypothetical protein